MLKTEFLNKLKNSGVDITNYDFSLLPEEFTSKSEVTYKCLIHDEEITRLVQNTKSGLCTKCSIDKRSRKLKDLLKEVEPYYQGYTFHFKESQMDLPYKIKSKFDITCPEGHTYPTHFNSLITCRTYCGFCEGNVRETIDTLNAKIEAKYPEAFKYVKGEYVNQHSLLIYQCLNCLEEFEITGNRILTLVHGLCPTCSKQEAGKRRLKPQEQFIKDCLEVHGDKYDYSITVYKGAAQDIDVRCPVHDYCFTLRAGDHIHNKQGCPKCSRLSSSKQKALYLWIKNTFSFLQVEEEYSPSWLKLYGSKKPSELDIYIPELNLAIEYNGTYWHSEDLLLSSNKKDYHKEKYDKCLENGIKLIHIFEFENLVKWQKKLSNYLRSPDKYEILFYNEKRTHNIFTVKGKSVLKLKQHT